MKKNSKKVPINLNTVIGFTYLNSVNHQLLFLKSKLFEKELKKLEKKKIKSNLEKLGNSQEKELLRIEIITTTMHYAEVFASLILAMKKYRQFHRFLIEYRVEDIINFYKILPKRKPQYIAKILQYPYPNKYVDQKLHADLKNTIVDATSELKKLSEFYFAFRSFYNSYKHGFRIVTLWEGEPGENPDTITSAYFADREKLNVMHAAPTKNHIGTALDLCSFIFRFLDNAQNIFEQRVIRKEKKFKMKLLHKKSQ